MAETHFRIQIIIKRSLLWVHGWDSDLLAAARPNSQASPGCFRIKDKEISLHLYR